MVKYSASPPVIDGVISVSEYALASPAQEAFFLTGSNKKPSPSRYSLMALWDDQCLYVAFWCSDTGIPSQEGFPGDNITQTWPGFIFKGLYEDVTFLFDPGNPADNVHDKEKGDSYQISVQLVNGIRPAGISKPPYLFTEARYNSLFGGATWRPTDIAVGVNLAG
ncbi:MAG TPA: hypothetical protein PLB62_13235, partial [Candidatus Sumerlaeota bacterium]|nr:hypothetical protein [Candidatus Sumerlaeota bacterium]